MTNEILFPISEYWWLYLSFLGFVGLMLLLDLGVFHRKAHVVGFKEALYWSVFWIALSLGVNYGFYQYALYRFPPDAAGNSIAGTLGLEFLTGFVVEKALAVDNIFVFVMVFAAFKIPAIYQHRILFFGILGAIFFRAIFIALGSQLMAYHWVIVFFGAFLIFTGVKMLFMRKEETSDPKDSRIIKLLSRFLPITHEIHGQKFFVKKDGVRFATPLFLALIFLEVTDVVFAVDSVPAIFAISKEPLIVFCSNILAILGLRSLYFCLSGVIDRFIYVKHGLAFVLIFVGLKMAWLNELMGGKFPIWLSLSIIATLIGGSILLSLFVTSRRKASSERRLTA